MTDPTPAAVRLDEASLAEIVQRAADGDSTLNDVFDLIAALRAAWADRDQAQADRDAAVNALDEVFGDDPCIHDHHGYCQQHSWLLTGECPTTLVKRIREGKSRG